MKENKRLQSKTSKPELKKSDIGHKIAEAASQLGAQFEKPAKAKPAK